MKISAVMFIVLVQGRNIPYKNLHLLKHSRHSVFLWERIAVSPKNWKLGFRT